MQTAPELSLLGFLQKSFARYLQPGIEPDRCEDIGLHAVFKSLFPVKSMDTLASIEYVSYLLERPKYNLIECQRRGITYASPIKVVIRLVTWEESDVGILSIRNFKEQEVYFGEVPLLTERCTFFIEGEERSLPSQLKRSAGVFFSKTSEGVPYALFTSWHGLGLSITKQKSSLLMRLFLPEDLPLSSIFYPTPKTLYLPPQSSSLYHPLDKARLGKTAPVDLKDPSGEIIVAKKKRITAAAIKKLRASGALGVELSRKEARTYFSAEDIYQGDELLLKKDRPLIGGLAALWQRDIFSLQAYSVTEEPTPATFAEFKDEAALLQWFEANIKEFSLSTPGRLQLNDKLSLTTDLSVEQLTSDDLTRSLEHLNAMSLGSAPEDDPSHLGGLQLSCIGELLSLHSWAGIAQVALETKIRMSLAQELETLMPHDLINHKPFSIAVRRMIEKETVPFDTSNPLTSLSQLRRIEAPEDLAPHPTHKGRISNDELALYCRPNEYLFLEAPYLEFKKGKLKSLLYYSAYETERLLQSGAKLSSYREPPKEQPSKKVKQPNSPAIELVEVSPLQNLSLTEAIGRSLVGALPLYEAEPLPVPSLLEAAILKESGAVLTAKSAGEVIVVSPEEILLSLEESFAPVRYSLQSLTPNVTVGQRIETGAVLAFDLSSRGGRLSLGRNVLVEFSEGLLGAHASTQLQSLFTSRHFTSLECIVFDTREGREFLQKNIPEVEEGRTRHLDDCGIVALGAHVLPGDVLVGKRSPIQSGINDSSLYVPEGCSGKVIRVDIFSRPGEELNQRQQEIREARQQPEQTKTALIEAVQRKIRRQACALLVGHPLSVKLLNAQGEVLLAKGTMLTEEALQPLSMSYLFEVELKDKILQQKLQNLRDLLDDIVYVIEQEHRPHYLPDILPPGVIMLIKLTIEQEKQLAIGDTLASQEGHRWEVSQFFVSDVAELRVPATQGAEKKQLYLVKAAFP